MGQIYSLAIEEVAELTRSAYSPRGSYRTAEQHSSAGFFRAADDSEPGNQPLEIY